MSVVYDIFKLRDGEFIMRAPMTTIQAAFELHKEGAARIEKDCGAEGSAEVYFNNRAPKWIPGLVAIRVVVVRRT